MATGGIPGFGETERRILAEVAAAVDALNFGQAYQVATDALNRGMRHAALFNARGLALHAAGRIGNALEEFRAALVYNPNDAVILNAVALCQIALGRSLEALQTLDKALAIKLDHPPTHYRRGQVLTNLGKHDAAQSAYERAIELDPNYAEALGQFAAFLARKREGDRARALAERALNLVPNQTMAVYALAMVEMAEKRFAQAEERLRGLITKGKFSEQERAALLGQLGDALDGQGRYAEAFAVYMQENEGLRPQGTSKIARGRAVEAAEQLTGYFERTSRERWKLEDEGGPVPDGPVQHIFLLGFIRSGTTLLEQVLASNPRIVALEEKGLLNIPSENFLTSNEGLDALANLGGPALAMERQRYWERVRANGAEIKGKVFVDKQPLNTVKLPLISRLFPRAKVLLALRDPRDVVFSCFRRHFALNATMYEFLKLDDAAKFYASVMRLAEIYRQKVPLNLFEHRYEDMVADFDGRICAVCDFIGVPFAETMREFDKNAPYVDLRSPSATQVRRPLYSEGVGQWRRYAKELAPILPILQPWVEKYGYSRD
jgi:tetratricopeptide (TPR) repeat protein